MKKVVFHFSIGRTTISRNADKIGSNDRKYSFDLTPGMKKTVAHKVFKKWIFNFTHNTFYGQNQLGTGNVLCFCIPLITAETTILYTYLSPCFCYMLIYHFNAKYKTSFEAQKSLQVARLKIWREYFIWWLWGTWKRIFLQNLWT